MNISSLSYYLIETVRYVPFTSLILVLIFLLLLIFKFLLIPHPSQSSSNLHHVIITGGSSGIGLAIAEKIIECYPHMCQYITLIARSKDKLMYAKDLLNQRNTHITVTIVPIDVMDADLVRQSVQNLYKNVSIPPPSLLCNVAGTSISSKFLETPIIEFKRLMEINYLGSVHITKAFLPHMISSPGRKAILFTSSAAGQVGIFGYSAYTPTKYALKGFAEVLQMELRPYNICISVAYPPDTKTPGYEKEQLHKPEETNIISQSSGLYEPSIVAMKILKSITQTIPPFQIYMGIEGWMLTTLTAGMSPVSNIIDATYQIFCMGFLRLISMIYLIKFDSIIRNVKKKNM